MKKIELGCLAISFILIILLICSLRSSWEKVEIKFDKVDNSIKFERDIYSTEIFKDFMIYNKNENNPNGTKIPIELRYSTSNSTHSINGFGALAIIFLFFNTINLLKVNIKFITSNVYSKFEKVSIIFVGLLVLFTVLSTFIAFGLKVDLCFEPASNLDSTMQCFQSRFVQEIKLKDINIMDNAVQLTLTGGLYKSNAASGFYLMLFCLIFSIVYAILSGLRYKEVRSPSSSIDYRFLYSGEDSSFLNDDDADEFDDSNL